MASVFVLLEAFNRKEAAALGFFPCATASFCFARILWGSKRGGFEQSVPRALRPAGQKRPGGAFLGRGSANPPGRTKSSTLWGVALFVLHGFYGSVKERIRTARAPRFASRGAETSLWDVSRARLGESLRARKKAHCNVLLQCAFWFDVILLSESLPAFGKDYFVDKEKNHH